jgi:hypothetical protein
MVCRGQGLLVPLVLRATLERRETRVMQDQRATQVLRAQRVLLAPRVPPGHRERLVQPDLPARRASQALQEAQAPKD